VDDLTPKTEENPALPSGNGVILRATVERSSYIEVSVCGYLHPFQGVVLDEMVQVSPLAGVEFPESDPASPQGYGTERVLVSLEIPDG
jgi:hypothetical protein